MCYDDSMKHKEKFLALARNLWALSLNVDGQNIIFLGPFFKLDYFIYLRPTYSELL